MKYEDKVKIVTSLYLNKMLNTSQIESLTKIPKYIINRILRKLKLNNKISFDKGVEVIKNIFNDIVIPIEIEGNNNYFISGENVYSLNFKNTNRPSILKKSIDSRGYYQVSMTINNESKPYLFHRLIAQHFIENKCNKPCINHKDGNKLNNNIDNLEWCTYSENINHAIKTGLRKSPNHKLGSKSPYSKNVLQYDLNGNFIREWGSLTEAANNLNIKKASISSCCKGRNKTSGGYIWKLKN